MPGRRDVHAELGEGLGVGGDVLAELEEAGEAEVGAHAGVGDDEDAGGQEGGQSRGAGAQGRGGCTKSNHNINISIRAHIL
jgi:hypothetical protein